MWSLLVFFGLKVKPLPKWSIHLTVRDLCASGKCDALYRASSTLRACHNYLIGQLQGETNGNNENDCHNSSQCFVFILFFCGLQSRWSLSNISTNFYIYISKQAFKPSLIKQNNSSFSGHTTTMVNHILLFHKTYENLICER